MGIDTVRVVIQDKYFLERVGDIFHFLVNSKFNKEQIGKQVEELARDLIRLANKAGYPPDHVRADDGVGRHLWRAAAESFVEKNKESVARIKITTDILTKSTRDDVALRGPDIGVGLRLNEMAKVVYVLAGVIKHGYYDELQTVGSGAHKFFALPK